MPKLDKERILFQNKLFTIKEVEVSFDSGEKQIHQFVEKTDTALVVPLTEKGTVIFVREYFTAIDQYELNLPKGKVEQALSPEETANKELQEEIGYKAEKLDKLAVLTMAPSYYTQKAHVFLARNLVPGSLAGDEIVPPEQMEYPLADFEELIDAGTLRESRCIAALYLVRRFLAKNK